MRRVVHVLLLLIGVAACRSTDSGAPSGLPRSGPPVVTRIDASLAGPLHFGSPWAAEVAQVTTLGLDDCLSVRARFFRLAEKPWIPSGVSLDHRVRAVIDPTTGESRLAPVLGAGGIFLDERGVAEAPLAKADLLADVAAALPAEVTDRIACYTERPIEAPVVSLVPASLVTEKIAVLLRRRCTGHTRRHEPLWTLDCAIELATRGPPVGPPEPSVSPPRHETRPPREDVDKVLRARGAETRDRSELLELRDVASGATMTFAAVVPSPFEAVKGWLLVIIGLAPPPLASQPGAAIHERAVAQVQAQLAGERARSARPEPPFVPAWAVTKVDRAPLDLDAAREEMKTWPRRGLVQITEHASAALALDVALELEGPALVELAVETENVLDRRARREAIAARLGYAAGASLASLHTLRWDLDLAALQILLRPENRKAARVVLERRYGAAFEADVTGIGRPLLPQVRSATTHAELMRVMIERNLLGLEDTRPGVRIVASRFLSAFAPGLQGYDPFGPFEERRLAVDRLWQLLLPEETP